MKKMLYTICLSLCGIIIMTTPGLAAEAYNGPLIDSHFHIPANQDESKPNPQLGRDFTLQDLDGNFQAENTTAVFGFFSVFEGNSADSFIAAAENAEANYPDRFIRFLMPPSADDNPPTVGYKKIRTMLEDHPGLFQGYGEIGLYSFGGKNGRQYPPNHPIFKKIYPLARKHNLLVYFHPGNNQADNFRKTLKNNPDINFIVHGDQIRDNISDLMDEYPNIYYTIDNLYGDQYLIRQGVSKQEFFDAIEDEDTLLDADMALWEDLINNHPNRVMWGTDRGDVRWAYNRRVGKRMANYARAFISRLDPAVQENFAYKNAQRLIDNSGIDN